MRFALFTFLLLEIVGAFCIAEQYVQAISVEEKPVIDGRLDESVWELADPVSSFVQLEPIQGEPASNPTFARVLYDDDCLYVGITALKTDMDALAVTATRRDSRMFSDDFVQVELDTYQDCRNCYVFALNALGTQVDGRVANEGSNADRGGTAFAWDCDWQGKAWRGEDRWTAEFAIPFSELRFPKQESATWGINFRRNDESQEEESSWSDLGNNDWAVSRFGNLRGLNTLSLNTQRSLEFKPYATVKPQSLDDADSIDTDADMGVDLRYPFSNFTLDFTINPDFAQIEADPDHVNLSDIPERFPEKRPFFQEGAELFQMPVELFYSRRVEDLIVGGKAVGKSGPYSFAVVDAQARPEDTEEDDTESNYAVARVTRDIGSQSSVGFLVVNKQSPDFYDRAISTDFRLDLPSDTRVTGQAALNWNKEHPSSHGLVLDVSRRTNTWMTFASVSDAGREFDVESGFTPRVDRRGYRGFMGYRFQLSGDNGWRRLFIGSGGEQLWDHDGELRNERIELEFSTGYKDFFTFFGPEQYYYVNDEGERFTDRTFGFFLGWFPPKWASVRSRFSIGERENKNSFFMSPEITLKPTERFSVELELQRLVEDDELTHLTRRFSSSYQFTQRMHVKGSAEFTKDGDRRIFAVYGYEFRPESHFFLVYSDNLEYDEDDGGRETHGRILFVKLSYLIKAKWL